MTLEINGEPATVGAVHRAAAWNYGHYTSMQVRDWAVTGLTMHLRRLAESSRELFPDAAVPDGGHVRALIGQALGDRRDASVRVTVLPGPGGMTQTDIMVAVSEPVPDTPRPALRVTTVEYERDMPHLKHLATMGLTVHGMSARRAGFDDALFIRRDGTLTEGTVWNAAFWDGERVIWPSGPQLAGITMLVLRQGLSRLGVPDVSLRMTRDSPAGMTAAAAANSHCPAQPIATIDEHVLPQDEVLVSLLRRAWQEIDREPL
ncbi:aminotransferase class IV [Actinoplanes sp. G11-F43]|uniref:aminotransferase class IV n=1 Tax=Actinoplanes sp. G11-F43 TaxID=3424130 RepID=UPI003D34DEDB